VAESQMILETLFVFANFVTVRALHLRGIAMLILHVPGYCAPMNEFGANLALDFTAI
jgi:hypothetical protein